jgi:DNA-directed RNA polymerase I and III subunit RPAC2
LYSGPWIRKRLMIKPDGTAFEALEKGLDDLMDLCDVVTDKFTTARADFASKP